MGFLRAHLPLALAFMATVTIAMGTSMLGAPIAHDWCPANDFQCSTAVTLVDNCRADHANQAGPTEARVRLDPRWIPLPFGLKATDAVLFVGRSAEIHACFAPLQGSTWGEARR